MHLVRLRERFKLSPGSAIFLDRQTWMSIPASKGEFKWYLHGNRHVSAAD
jgi:hypothetical protein